MEDCYLHDREFKIAFRRKLNEIQKEKRKKKQFNEFKNKINGQRSTLPEKLKILKKNKQKFWS